jgi:hypothetical protein
MKFKYLYKVLALSLAFFAGTQAVDGDFLLPLLMGITSIGVLMMDSQKK